MPENMNPKVVELKIILNNDDLMDFINDENRIKKITNTNQKISKTLYSSDGPLIIKGRLLEVLSFEQIQTIWSGLHIGMRTGKQGFDGVFLIDNDIYILESKYRSQAKITWTIIKESAESLTSASTEVSLEADEIYKKYGLGALASIFAIKQINESELKNKIASLFIEYSSEKIEYAIFSFGISDDLENKDILKIKQDLFEKLSDQTNINSEKNIKIIIFVLTIGEGIVNEIKQKD